MLKIEESILSGEYICDGSHILFSNRSFIVSVEYLSVLKPLFQGREITNSCRNPKFEFMQQVPYEQGERVELTNECYIHPDNVIFRKFSNNVYYNNNILENFIEDFEIYGCKLNYYTVDVTTSYGTVDPFLKIFSSKNKFIGGMCPVDVSKIK